MTTNQVPLQTLRAIPAFHNFNEGEYQQVADVLKPRTFAPGERVIEQGKRSQHLWILLEGRCDVIKDSKLDGPVSLATLEPFSLFGEMSFFSPAPHSANVVAKTLVRLLSISRPDYDDMIHDGVSVAYKLAYNIVESVCNRLRRMDDCFTELATDGDARHDHAKPQKRLPEWGEFRNKLFKDGWNL